MTFKIPGQGNAEDGRTGTDSPSQSWSLLGLKVSLSRLQTFVSLAAGLVSITGALVAIPNFFKPGPGKGELVAIVQDAKTDKALYGATIEILSSEGVLVTTLSPNSSGKASCMLNQGRFRVRVSHPGFGGEVREVQVVSRESTQVRVQMRASSPVPRSIRRIFGR